MTDQTTETTPCTLAQMCFAAAEAFGDVAALSGKSAQRSLVTTPDDGIVRSHDEVEQLLRYALPGARVTLAPVAVPGTAQAAASTRRYDIVLPRVGREPITTASVYSLPCDAERLARGARAEADRALSAA